MAMYQQGGGAPPQKNGFKKGLGFVPNSLSVSYEDTISLLLKHAPKIPKGQCLISDNVKALYESGSTIPLFDIEQIFHARGEERNQLIGTFGDALAQVGFIGLKAENLTPLVHTIYADMKRYFRQPLETKLTDWQKFNEQRGYVHKGIETGPKAPRSDFKESFFVTPDFKEWPSGYPAFSNTVPGYHSTLSDVSEYLMGFLMEYLGENQEDAKEIGHGDHLLRLAYYPSIRPGDDPAGVWSYAHRDKNVLSILSQGTVPGLQFYSRRGHWEPVVAPENYLVVTTGLLLQHKTCGRIKARWHRVHNPGGKHTRGDRLSTVFYAYWPENFSLKPYQKCVDLMTGKMSPKRRHEYLEKYPDITVYQRQTDPASLLALK